MTLLIAAGGTGGHLYPAVALAHEFLRQAPAGAVRFVGTARGLERTVVPREGFALDLVAARPVMGMGWRRAATALLALPFALWQSLRLLRAHRADLVIGIGGYSSPPVLLAAWLLRVPRAILEPNAHAGMANRALAPFTDRIFLAFREAGTGFSESKVRVAGTPIRQAFFDAHAQEKDATGMTVLIFGGSQGAQAINTAMIEALPMLRALPNLTIVHQTGEKDHARVQAAYAAAGFTGQTRVMPFVFDMPATLRGADLIVSRAGAVTVAELTAVGKPAILVPLPQAIYQHQARNAAVLEQAGAAVVLPQASLSGAALGSAIVGLLTDRERLRAMGDRSRSLGRTDSAATIIRECLALVGRGRREVRAGG